MYRRQEPLRFSRFMNMIEEGIIRAIGLCVVGSVVGYGLFAAVVAFYNSHQGAEESLQKTLYSYRQDEKDTSTQAAARRQDLAQSLIDMREHLEATEGADQTSLVYEDEDWKLIQKVADTGKPLVMDTERWSFTMPYSDYRWSLHLLFAIAALGAYCMPELVRSSHRNNHRVADLPWNKPWPWICTFLLGPIFWVGMTLSALSLRRTPAQDVQTAEDGEDHDEMWADLRTPERQPEEKRITKTYPSAPNAARSTYVAMRTGGSRLRVESTIKELGHKIAKRQSDARELGVKLRETQAKINRHRARQASLQQAIDTGEAVVSDLVAGEEFDRITRLPGVIACQVVNDRLRLVIRAQCAYEDQYYDLGDWQIDIGTDTERIGATELRSGVRKRWEGDYPVYRLGTGIFCFGDRERIINEHLQKTQYLEALALAVECLSGVNEEDEYRIPRAFKLIKQEE